MIDIVLHEREWAENMLLSPKMGTKPMTTLNRIAKYYFSLGYPKGEIGGMLEDYILRCDPDANIVKWQALLDHVVKRCDRYSLIDIPYIGIAQKELDAIAAIDGIMARRFMFALLCLAKYSLELNPKCNGWVTKDMRLVFRLANVVLTARRQGLLINDLWNAGYLAYGRAIDNLNLQVRIIDMEGSPVLKITDFRNLGYQYGRHCDPARYIECQNCGIVERKTANNKKYCSTCAVDMNRANTRARKASSKAA